MSPRISCPTDLCVERLLAGTLTALESGRVRSHVSACARCQSVLDRVTDSEELKTWAECEPFADGDLAESVAFLDWMARERTEREGRNTGSRSAVPDS
jgi:hypothetical protein